MGHGPGPKGFSTVIIDAGHGGRDSGAISRITGAQEKVLALDTAYRLKALLTGHVDTVLIRNNDHFVDLDDRVSVASRRDSAILVSIHYNSGPSHVRGPETYYWRVDSHGLAKRFQSEMEKVTPRATSRGMVRRRLRLTRNPVIPSVLVECGYLSNPTEARWCNSSIYRQRMAAALARAILSQKRLGDRGTGPLPRAINAPPSRSTDPPGS